MAQHNETGKWGEDVAAEYLAKQGFRIVERNWRFGHKEVDIIATDGRMLLFAEVRTRSNTCYGDPSISVDWKKQKNLMAAMRNYIGTHQIYLPSRFDIITVVGSPYYHTVQQMENAVSNFMY